MLKKHKKLNITDWLMIMCVIVFIISLVLVFIFPKQSTETFDKAHSISDLLEETDFYENREYFEQFRR